MRWRVSDIRPTLQGFFEVEFTLIPSGNLPEQVHGVTVSPAVIRSAKALGAPSDQQAAVWAAVRTFTENLRNHGINMDTVTHADVIPPSVSPFPESQIEGLLQGRTIQEP